LNAGPIKTAIWEIEPWRLCNYAIPVCMQKSLGLLHLTWPIGLSFQDN